VCTREACQTSLFCYTVFMNPFVDDKGKPIPPMPEGSPRANALHLTPQTSYFFKRGKEFISVDANSAWQIYSGQNQVIGRQIIPWVYVGRTNGKKYIEAVKKAQKELPIIGKEKYQELLEEALKAEYLLAKKDKTPPPNFNVIDRGGYPINLQNYGN
jgi:hypothetical protein